MDALKDKKDKKTSLRVDIDPEMKSHLEKYLKPRGLKKGWFIRRAILEKLEREEVGLELSRKEEKPKC